MSCIRAARIAAAVTLLAGAVASAAHASAGALSQLPGTAGCVSNDAYGGTPGACAQASGLRLVQSVALSPDGTSLYSAAVQSDAIAAFSRNNTTGQLTQVAGAGGCIQDASATAEPGCVTGQALQVPDWVTVSPDGANVYASSFTSQAIDIFSRDGGTGALTQLSGSSGCVSSAAVAGCAAGRALAGAGGVVVTPDGKNVYEVSFGNNLSLTGGIAVFARGDGGTLAQLSGPPGCIVDSSSTLSGCTLTTDSPLRGASSVAVSPDGSFVYVAARYSEAVTVYKRDPVTGALARVPGSAGCIEETGTTPCTQGTPATGFAGPNSISMSADGSHVYVASFTNGQGSPGDTVAVFSRDSTTGALTQLPGAQGCFSGGGADPSCTAVPVLGGDFAVTVSPDGGTVYVTAYQSNAITVFSADSSGALTPLSPTAQCVSSDGSSGQCAAGVSLRQPHQTAVSPDGGYVYVASHGTSSIDSFAAVAPAAATPSNTDPPRVSGSATTGEPLSSTGGAWSGTESGYTYGWESCDSSGANCAPIAGTSTQSFGMTPMSTTYTPTSADLGRTVRVVVTAINSAGRTTATSDPTPVVQLPIPPPSNTTAPAISGSAVLGQVLTASPGVWANAPTSYAYQWQSCDGGGANCVPIAGASAGTHTLGADDLGHTIAVSVTATNRTGSATASSEPTGTVIAPPTNTALPAISGTPILGHLLTASTGTWTGNPTGYGYQWESCDGTGANCIPIPGATAGTRTLAAGDVGHTIRVLVTATNAAGSVAATSLPTVPVGAPPVNTSAPAITGETALGHVLTVTAGAWTGNPTSYGYQWLSCNGAGAGCLPIGGATGSTHMLTVAEAGHTVRALVTAANPAGAASVTSAPTPVIPPAVRPPAPRVFVATCAPAARRGPKREVLACRFRSATAHEHLGRAGSRASVSRGRTVYASGLSGSRASGGYWLLLTAQRKLPPGSYELTLRSTKPGRTVSRRFHFTLRSAL